MVKATKDGKQITIDELGKFRLNFSRCSNYDVQCSSFEPNLVQAQGLSSLHPSPLSLQGAGR